MLESETSPPILELPNEILSIVLSCFIISAKASLNTRSWRDPHPILVLRKVCRRFRAVANELEFWYDDDFEIHTLLSPNIAFRNSRPAEIQRQTKFLTSLFTDVHLVDCLGRKKSWTFYCFRLFLLVLDLLPLFRQTVTTLKFESINDDEYHESDTTQWYHEVIPTLGGFAQLTALHLDYFKGFDFDYIVKFCPALESLRLTRTVIGPFHDCSGTLEGLSNLQEFSLSDLLEFSFTENPASTGNNATSFLPLSSVASLTALHLHTVHPSETEYYTNSLIKFTNLTSLHLGPLTTVICDRIIQADFKLTSFSVELDPPSVPGDKLLEIFSARCLQDVKKLEIFGETSEILSSAGPYSSNERFSIIEAITHLRCLQHLELSNVYVEDRSWAGFSCLANIKRFIWSVVVDDEIESAWEVETAAESALEAAFAAFPEKPIVELRIEAAERDEDEYPDWAQGPLWHHPEEYSDEDSDEDYSDLDFLY
jgi:hypothetical protein